MKPDTPPDIGTLDQALAAARASADKRAEAACLRRLGDAHRSLHNFQVAAQYFDEAFTIARHESDTQILFRLGITYLGLQEKSKALQSFDEMFSISASEVHQSLVMMAEVSDRMGDKTQASHHLERALAVAEVLGEYQHQITCLGRLARKDIDDGKHHEAIQKHNRARLLAQEHDDKAKEADSLAEIANIYKSLGNQPEALSNYDQALELIRQTQDRTDEILLLNDKGSVHEKFGEREHAEAQYELALAMARQYNNRTGECDSLYNLGMLQKKQGNLELAIKYFEDGHRLIGEGKRLDDWEHRVKTPIAFFLYTALLKTYESTGNYVAALHLMEQNLAENRASSPKRLQELEEHIARLNQNIAEQASKSNQDVK
ncbi:MAG: tetratricopeptide repeat protein [Anaerolineae bacterium]